MASTSNSEWDRYMNSLDTVIFNKFGLSNPDSIGVHAGPVAPRTIQHYYNPPRTASTADFTNGGSNDTSNSTDTMLSSRPAPAAAPVRPYYEPSLAISEDGFTDNGITNPTIPAAPRALQFDYAQSIAVSDGSSAPSADSRVRISAETFPSRPAAPQYAQSIYMSEDRFPGGVKPPRSGRPRYSPSEAAGSMRSAAEAPSVFSNESWANTSVTSAQLSEDASVQTADEQVPGEAQEEAQEQPEPDNGVRLLCEFIAYTDCDAEFRLDEVDAWIDHIANDHLQSILPREAICWFCNQGSGGYRIQPDREVSQEKLESLFRRRMEHIAEHFRTDGMIAEDIRPDYRFLDHIHEQGLISDEMFEKAKNYAEKHPYPVTINGQPFKQVKPDRVIHVQRPKRGPGRAERLQIFRE